MTEQQWLASDDPMRMLYLLFGQECHDDGPITPLRVKGIVLRRMSPRKLKLFSCACCRLVWALLVDDRSRKAVAVAEQFADSKASEEELREADLLARNAWLEMGTSGLASAANMAWSGNAHHAVRDGRALIPPCNLAHLVRDVFGNPFRPQPPSGRKAAAFWQKTLESWLRWNDGTIPKIAQSIYDERRFEDMPILADALEDSGCDNEDILAHCRQPCEHVRGCWVVDLLLGKE